MKIARYCILSLLALVVGVNTFAADYKVVEKSERKKPSWVGKTEQDYIIVSAENVDLEKAKAACMESIKQEILNAVAVNVTSEISSQSRQTNTNGEYDLYDEYNSKIKSVAANLPYITGVTIANAEASYWELRQDKKSKEKEYLCYIKYPFSKVEKAKLIYEFKEYDAAQYARLQKVKEQSAVITDVEEIGRHLAELEPLIAYFFDAARKQEAVALQNLLLDMYNNISVLPVSNRPGEYIYKLVVGDQLITCSRLPRAKSEYAYNLSVIPVDNMLYAVKYQYDGCVPEEENSVELLFNFGRKSQKHVFNFSPLQGELSVIPQGEVLIKAPECKPDTVTTDTLTFTFKLRSKTAVDYTIESVEFFIPEYPTLRVIDFGGERSCLKGENTLTLKAVGKARAGVRKASLVNGSMMMRAKDAQNPVVVPLRLPYKIYYY